MRYTFTNFTYGNSPEAVPVGEQCEAPEGWDHERFVRAAGFSPDDEEICICRLDNDWDGYPEGSYVVTEYTIEGHGFCIATQSPH